MSEERNTPEQPKKLSPTEQLREELKQKGHPGYRDIDTNDPFEVDIAKPAMEEIVREIPPLPAGGDSPSTSNHKRPIMEEFDPSIHKPSLDEDLRALRPTLTEPFFRKYEKYIAIASYGSYKINPRLEPVGKGGKGVSSHTFTVSLRDAILGMFRFGYVSHIIPSSLHIESLKVHEMADGRVKIENSRLLKLLSDDEVLAIKLSLKKASDPSI